MRSKGPQRCKQLDTTRTHTHTHSHSHTHTRRETRVWTIPKTDEQAYDFLDGANGREAHGMETMQRAVAA